MDPSVVSVLGAGGVAQRWSERTWDAYKYGCVALICTLFLFVKLAWKSLVLLVVGVRRGATLFVYVGSRPLSASVNHISLT